MQLPLYKVGKWVLCVSRGLRISSECSKRSMLHKGLTELLEKWKWRMHWVHILIRIKTSVVSKLSELWKAFNHKCHQRRGYYQARIRFIHNWTIHLRLSMSLRSRLASSSSTWRCDIFEHCNSKKREIINLYCNFLDTTSSRLVWINCTWGLFNRNFP